MATVGSAQTATYRPDRQVDVVVHEDDLARLDVRLFEQLVKYGARQVHDDLRLHEAERNAPPFNRGYECSCNFRPVGS
jgi:hypothetical protein